MAEMVAKGGKEDEVETQLKAELLAMAATVAKAAMAEMERGVVQPAMAATVGPAEISTCSFLTTERHLLELRRQSSSRS